MGTVVLWQAGAASGSSGDAISPSVAAAPAGAAPDAQTHVAGCQGELSDESRAEQVVISRGFAK
eukprot:3553237-Pyramimonas_sp.AAC.1